MFLRKWFLSGLLSAASLFSINGNDSLNKDLVFHFDFKDGNGKPEMSDTTEKFKCISQNGKLLVQRGALRIAPGAKIYIPSEKMPDISKQLTISAWILKRSTPDVCPILFKGVHSDPIQFTFGIGWRYPEFCYKNTFNQYGWKGVYVKGDFGLRISYANPQWIVPGAAFIESSGFWRHVSAVFNEGKVELYIDGKLVAQGASERPEYLKANDLPFWIGAERLLNETENYRVADMLINDLRLYSKAVSNEDVQMIYETEKIKYPQGSQIPAGENHLNALAPCLEYYDKDYDPQFTKKLKITAEYEKKLLPVVKECNIASSSLKTGNGQIDFVVNGKPEFPMAFFPVLIYPDGKPRHEEASAAMRDFAAAGVDMTTCITMSDFFWIDEGKYEWKKQDDIFRRAINANPRAKLIIWLSIMDAPKWFIQKYPEEMEKWDAGGGEMRMTNNAPLGSDKWHQVCIQMIKDLVAHVEKSDYAGHVCAYLSGGGMSGEWYWPGGQSGVTGYSIATKRSFQNWLKTKYKNDVSELQKAWKHTDVTFENASVPSPAEREKCEMFLFRDIQSARNVFDYREYMTDRTVMGITETCRTIKETSGFKKLTFVYCGYPFDIALKKIFNNGILSISRVFESPYVDVIATPIDYSKRRGGQPGLSVNPFNGSALLHGKLLWQEDDLRTHFYPKIESGRTADLAETLTVMERCFGLALTQNAGFWFFPFDNAWFHQEDMMRKAADIKNAGEKSLDKNKASIAQVAIVFDCQSVYYQAQFPNMKFFKDLSWEVYQNASMMGAPFDVYLSDDLANPKMADYKLYIFVNMFYADKAKREFISAKIRKNNSVSVWCYAPGFIDENGFSIEGMEKLTGIKFEVENIEKTMGLQLADKKSDISKYAQAFSIYKVGPVFSCSGEGVNIIGTANGKGALAVKDFGHWRSVYSLMPLTKELLMGLCDYAGIHVYSRSFDILTANKSYIMLHTSTAGEKIIKLPNVSAVTEILTGNQINKKTDKIVETLPAKSTRIYEIKE